MDEATREQQVVIDNVSGKVRRCTDPKEKPRRLNKTKLVLWCQMLSATFEYEVKWQFRPWIRILGPREILTKGLQASPTGRDRYRKDKLEMATRKDRDCSAGDIGLPGGYHQR